MFSMQTAAATENKIFQALADPSRRAIFESLMRGEAAVKHLTARFDVSQPAISQHLATLKDCWRRWTNEPHRHHRPIANRIPFIRIRFASFAGKGVARAHRSCAARG